MRKWKNIVGIWLLMFVLLGFALQTPTEAAQYAYITNYDDDTVSVINTASYTVDYTITVGDGPYGVAVTPDGTEVYVTNGGDDTVSVIDTAIQAVTHTIPVGDRPYGVAVSPDGTEVYVTNGGDDTVSVIDTATYTVIHTIPVGYSPMGVAVAVTPDGTEVYVTNQGGCDVSVINTATHTVTDTIFVDCYPYGVAVTPDGTQVYVATGGYWLHDSRPYVSVIDTATHTRTQFIKIGYGYSDPGEEVSAYGVAVTPDGTEVYVTDNEGTVSVINTATFTVTVAWPGEFYFYTSGVSVTPDGTELYMAKSEDNTVWVIDTAAHTPTHSIPVGNRPVAFGQFIADGIQPVAYITGSVEGVIPVKVICRNLDTRQTVVITDGSTPYDCTAAGLVSQTGDRIDIIIKGTADLD